MTAKNIFLDCFIDKNLFLLCKCVELLGQRKLENLINLKE